MQKEHEMSEKDALIDKLEAERKRAEAELETLQAQVQSKAADAALPQQYETQRRELESGGDDIDDRLQQLQEGGEAAFAELKEGAERALDRLKSALGG
jgi:chromosome segregation ATPase